MDTVMGRPSKLRLAELVERAEEATTEVATLREEMAAAGRYLQLVGGRIVHLVTAEYDLAAKHHAHEVVRLGDRLIARGTPDGAA